MPITFEQRLLAHPANQALLKYLSFRASAAWTAHPICRPEETEQPYLTLGVHPDVVERLWKQLSKDLPERCDWVVYSTPVLLNPSSAVIFAVAVGTVYAMRLPFEARKQAAEVGAKKHTSIQQEFFGSGALRRWMDVRDLA